MRIYPDFLMRNRDLEAEGLRWLRVRGIPTPEEFYDQRLRPILEGTNDDGHKQDAYC